MKTFEPAKKGQACASTSRRNRRCQYDRHLSVRANGYAIGLYVDEEVLLVSVLPGGRRALRRFLTEGSAMDSSYGARRPVSLNREAHYDRK